MRSLSGLHIPPLRKQIKGISERFIVYGSISSYRPDHYRIAVTESKTPNKDIREKSIVIYIETKDADSESMVAA